MNLLTQLSKYIFIFLMLLFALRDYTYLGRHDEDKKLKVLKSQVRLIFIMEILGYAIIFGNTLEVRVLLLLMGILLYNAVTLLCYRSFYPKCSMLLVNNMLMLLGVGFIMIARINFDQAWKQFLIAALGTAVALVIPVIIRKLRILPRLKWLYAVLGIVALMGVLALAAVSGGARLSISIGGISFQLSEIVKITMAFYVGSSLAQDTSLKNIIITTVVAIIHVGILVLSTDLGTALVFFVMYIAVLFVATRKPVYPLAGLGVGALGALLAYHLFAHVRKRVEAWRDPFQVYSTSGYQIAQGLFAIGAGGWFGTGLYLGKPNTIPVATKDFMFAALCEEFGIIFCICLLMVCMSLYILILNISILIRDRFYKLVALGLGTEYAFQVFLTVGGVTKLIPMTGITLPLVSYGGSSVISTICMLAIIEGMYILREDEGEEVVEKKRTRLRSGRRDR
ncbi:MAG: FtsW/RodA/SpoVE family cell cycle protein [Lachnospiraceae bacterium]|nr:FtsW/RodA/SpoVE family cell cycle protein [Lachnospiraceae bacterium]